MSKDKEIKAIGGKHYCRECVYAKDYHEKNMDGQYFMCKCKYHKRSMFLNLDCCKFFKKK